MRIHANNLKGFTIIELLASVGIVALVSTIFLANYHSSNRQAVLNAAARQLASDIRLAQSYTMGLKDFNGTVSAGGWGVEFSNARNYYEIFADNNDDQSYAAGSSEMYKKIDLPQGIETRLIYCSTDPAAPAACSGAGNNEGFAIFLPPNPDVIIKEDGNDCKSACLVVYDTVLNAEKHIKINQLGLVSTE